MRCGSFIESTSAGRFGRRQRVAAASDSERGVGNEKGATWAPFVLAEREGFEPSVRYHRTPTFQAGTLNHSATSPEGAGM